MTTEELSRYDGKAGRKAYVAVNGKIYDVTASPLWTDGDHQDLHLAGGDLTEELKSAPHVRAVIDRYPVVGHLEEPAPPKKKKWGIF
jgi:predicted heme/steroid binding protein